MISRLLLFATAAALAVAPMVAQPALITHSFPTEGERRRPDRTLAKVEAGSAAILVYSPDGRTLASAGHDAVVRIWEARTGEQGTGELLHTLTGHSGPVTAIAFAPDGKTLRSFSPADGVRLWDTATGQSVGHHAIAIDSTPAVFAPGVDPVLATAAKNQITFLNFESGAVLKVFTATHENVTRIMFSPDGKILAALTGKKTVTLWHTAEGGLLRDFTSADDFSSLAIADNQFAGGHANGTVQLWPLDRDRVLTLKRHSGVVAALAFSPKGDQLASAGDDLTVKVWDTPTGALLCSQEGHPADIVSVAFNPNGQKMASGDSQGSINYWTVPLPPLPPDELAKIAAAVPAKASAIPKKPRRLLVFWRADAILHKGGVPAANHAIALMGERTGAFTADFSRDYAALDPQILANYDALVLNSTAHLVISEPAKQALLAFAHGGGGIVGIHAAIDTFKGWPEGAAIVGATFAGHPWIPSGTYAIKVENPDDPLNRAWGGHDFKMHDELYEMGDPYSRTDRRVLLALDVSDPATAHPGSEPLHRKDRDFAIAWIKRAGAGRVFYGGFGHLADPFFDPRVLQFYLDGIQYALGDLAADASPKK